jgi:thiol-disulfide isomerase/thioredoxin
VTEGGAPVESAGTSLYHLVWWRNRAFGSNYLTSSMRSAMTRSSFAVAIVIGCLSLASADTAPQVYPAPPRLLIASGIDAGGNLIVSSTEQRQKKVSREVEKDGKKTTRVVTLTYPVTVLNRQTVSLKDATIYNREGKKITIAQARERLKEPTPILLTMLGEKVDPIYLKIMTKDTLTFVFPLFPEFKDIPGASPSGRAAAQARRKSSITVGEKLPELTLRTLDGKTVKLSELQQDARRTKTGVVVLSFWCSTCNSCRRVEHHLDKLARDNQGQAAVLALDANAGETGKKVAAFAKEKGLTLPIVLDPTGRSADVFGTEVTTTTLVIDGKGVLRYCGQFRQSEVALKAVLAGKEVLVKTTPHDG